MTGICFQMFFVSDKREQSSKLTIAILVKTFSIMAAGHLILMFIVVEMAIPQLYDTVVTLSNYCLLAHFYPWCS